MPFFTKLGSSGSESGESGSESEESILSGDEGQEQDRVLAQPKANGKFTASMFEKGAGSDDSEEESEVEEDDDEEEGLSDDSAADRQVSWIGLIRKDGAKTSLDHGESVLERCCVFGRGFG